MTTFDLATSVSTLIEFATSSRGDLIARFAELLHDARQNDYTNQDVIDQILATENGDALGSESMLKKYAQVIDIANGLGLANAIGYAQTWLAYSRASRVKGVDLAATFKNVSKAKSSAKKLKELANVNAETVVLKANGGNKSTTKPTKTTSQPAKSIDVATLSPTKLANALFKSLQTTKLTTSDYETLIGTLAEIDTLISAKMDG